MLTIRNADLTFYQNTNMEKRLFKKLNIHVNDTDFITVIGANGSGKSSLINVISGTYILQSGNVVLKNKDISKDPEWKRAKYIGRVFQNHAWGLAQDMTLIENFAIVLHKQQKNIFAKAVTPKIKEIIHAELSPLNINLIEKLSSKPSELSGGQCQSAALIMAVLANPLLLLLDEHTAALDPQSSINILSLTEKLVNERKLTAIMVTHNINNALQYGNRMIMMKNGIIVLDVAGEEKQKMCADEIAKMYGEI